MCETDRTYSCFFCWIRKIRELSFFSSFLSHLPFCPLSPTLPSFFLRFPPLPFPTSLPLPFPSFLFAYPKWQNSDPHMVIGELFTHKSYLFPPDFSKCNGPGMGNCWAADCTPGIGMTWDGCETWRGHSSIMRSALAVLSSLAGLLPRLRGIVFRTEWPSEYSLSASAIHNHLLWNGVLCCIAACPQELASMLPANESTGCFICA